MKFCNIPIERLQCILLVNNRDSLVHIIPYNSILRRRSLWAFSMIASSFVDFNIFISKIVGQTQLAFSKTFESVGVVLIYVTDTHPVTIYVPIYSVRLDEETYCDMCSVL